jgi:S-adenosyl-L-methionine hydrolase (adenosine-forming)
MSVAITLTTDFCTRDGYVGAMKGVIRSIAPGAVLDDITHRITPGRVDEAALVLENFHEFYPPGTIHLVVVDPAVGSSRRALAVASAGRFYVGPDNGVFEVVFRLKDQFTCYELTNEKYHRTPVSRTFHGRDIFAPAAAHLASGLNPEKLGGIIHDPVRLELSSPETDETGTMLAGHVVHVDRFGNLVSDLREQDLECFSADKSRINVSCCGVEIPGVSDYYAQVEKGDFVALIGSSGRLEIAMRDGSAAEKLGEKTSNAILIIRKSTI